jgi:microcystin degradation protein MlrC
MARIAVGGFQHETNTFAPQRASWADFERADAWPGFVRGPELIDAVHGYNIPIAGAVEALRARGHELLPLCWCSAPPSAHIEGEAYERVAGAILDDLAAQASIDGVYLDLHGAMVAEHYEDGEGELLRRIRVLLGDKVPIVASLDYHTNMTPDMVHHASAMVGYRTYPHIDMAATGGRAALLLDNLLSERRPLCKAYRQLGFLIPLVWQCTEAEPARGIFAMIGDIEQGALSHNQGIVSITHTPGFPPADIAQCGPALVVYGLARHATRPVVLADIQDNPGAGGTSDTVGLLRALIAQRARGAVIGMIVDPEAAEAAEAAGEGALLDCGIGAKIGFAGEAPVTAEWRVVRLGSGEFTGTGPMYGGARFNIGPMALVTDEGTGVSAVLAAKRIQAADQEMFRHVGVEPAEVPILALKSTVHFRADFAPIAERVLCVVSPGAHITDPTELPYRNLRKGIRLNPLGPARA